MITCAARSIWSDPSDHEAIEALKQSALRRAFLEVTKHVEFDRVYQMRLTKRRQESRLLSGVVEYIVTITLEEGGDQNEQV